MPNLTPRKRLIPIALAATVALTFGGTVSASAASAKTTTSNASVTAALTGEPSSLDPTFDTNLPSLNIYYEIYDQLTTINGKGKVVPRLATKWTSSDDLKTWTFTVRSDAKFSDGTPVTPEDVVWTYENAIGAKGSAEAGYVSTIASVSASGDQVTFQLKTPYAPFPSQTTLIPILPEATYKKMGAAAFAAKPVGSGPYSVVKWTKGVSVALTRNNSYWGTKGTVKNLTYQPVADDTTRANSIESGSLDVGLLGPAQVAAAKKAGNIKVVTEQSNRILYVGMAQTDKWLANVDIRKAISLAINRQAISKNLLNGSVKPTGQLVAPATFGYDKAISATKYDVSQAKKLIKASGYDGSTITLSYPTTGLPQVSQVSQSVASYLQAAGLKIKLDGQEAGTYAGNWFADKLTGIYVFAFAPSTMDADLPYELLAKTGSFGYFSDAQIDSLLTAELGESDATARKADFAKIAAIIQDKAYYAPLFTDTYTYGVKKGVAWSPRPEGFLNF